MIGKRYGRCAKLLERIMSQRPTPSPRSSLPPLIVILYLCEHSQLYPVSLISGSCTKREHPAKGLEKSAFPGTVWSKDSQSLTLLGETGERKRAQAKASAAMGRERRAVVRFVARHTQRFDPAVSQIALQYDKLMACAHLRHDTTNGPRNATWIMELNHQQKY